MTTKFQKSRQGGAPNSTFVPSLRDSAQTLAYPALTCRAKGCSVPAGLFHCGRRSPFNVVNFPGFPKGLSPEGKISGTIGFLTM